MQNLTLGVCLVSMGAYFACYGCGLQINQDAGFIFTANERGVLGILFVYIGIDFTRNLPWFRFGGN